MCKPGYTWNETLERCLPAAAYTGDKDKPEKPETPDTPKPPSADQAIGQEKAKRAKTPAPAKTVK